MNDSIRLFAISLLSVAILSLVIISPARADAWKGNDDGEFDHGGSGYPTQVGMRETLDRPMSWSSSPPDNEISLQYNPDWASSACCQWGGDWFQTGIISSSQGCAIFTIQIYNTQSTLNVFRVDQVEPDCSLGYLNTGATWIIREDMHSTADSHIVDVYYSISDGTTTDSGYLYPSPTNWVWMKSNLCWCGVGGSAGFTTFTSAHGTSTIFSDHILYTVDPPIIISTAENSNMRYTSWNNVGTTNMYQYFFWPFQTLADPAVTDQFFCTPTISCPGTQSGTVTVQAASGFSGTVSLSYNPPSPSGLTQITGPSSLQVSDGGSTTVGVTIYHGAVSGLFTWTITGTSGSFSSSGTITINEYVCSGTRCPTAPSG